MPLSILYFSQLLLTQPDLLGISAFRNLLIPAASLRFRTRSGLAARLNAPPSFTGGDQK
jgi:hypothetical protein